MAKVIGNINGVVFEGTYEDCCNWVSAAESEAEENYPDADENDLEWYTIMN